MITRSCLLAECRDSPLLFFSLLFLFFPVAVARVVHARVFSHGFAMSAVRRTASATGGSTTPSGTSWRGRRPREEEEEKESKVASDAALGLGHADTAPASAAEKADLEKRAELVAESKQYKEVENHRERQKVCIEGIRGRAAA